MTVPAHRSAFNILYSVFRHIRVAFAEVYAEEYGVNCDDALFDADKRDRSGAVKQLWLTIQPLQNTAGQRGFLLLQLKCSGRVGTTAARVTDRHGAALRLMAQRLRDSLMVKDIPLYDFTSDPLAPTAIPGKCVYVCNSAGKFRLPDAHQMLPPDARGVREEVFTYRFQTPFDGAGGQTYDEG